MMLSVIVDILSCDNLKPYISLMVFEMSRWLMPLAYMASTFFSIPETSRWCFGTATGSKVPSLSRGTWMVDSPLLVLMFLVL